MLKEYYYLVKPGIIYSNVLTAGAGFLLASKHINLAKLLALLLGLSMVIASACIFNNYFDRRIDIKMQRTKGRAMVKGLIPVRNALFIATLLVMLGLGTLLHWVNWLTAAICLVAFVDYVVLYSLAKRRSVHGTLVGTLAGAASVVAGYTAVTNKINVEAGILWLILTFWQMAHFYAIGIYRAKDYNAAGLPIWPIIKGVNTTKKYIIGYVIAFLVAAFAMTALRYTGYIYLAIIATVGLFWLTQALEGLRTKNDIVWARQVFLKSLIVIVVLSGALAIGARLP